MIKLLRFTNVLPISLSLLVLAWWYWSESDLSIFILYIGVLILSFITELNVFYQLKRKRDSGEIHIFHNLNNDPMFARWAIIIISGIISLLMFLDSADPQGWFWLTLFATKGIEHYLKINQWDVLIENNSVHEKSFWMKAIPISEITQVHINDQAQLEITTPKGMTLFKLDSGISVNLRDKIEGLQTTHNE